MTATALSWQSTAPLFFVAEIDTYVPGLLTLTATEAYGATPIGALTQLESPIAASYTVKVSDVGYRTDPADGAVVAYPPFLDTAFSINRQIQLDPNAGSVAQTWGSLTLINPARQWDTLVASNNTDTRNVRVLAGRKIPATDGRPILLDPRYASLTALFGGVAMNWQLNETALTIPLRDPAYWMARPLQRNIYLGTGGLNGTANLAGTPMPKCRGGTSSAPICNVTPILVDPVNLVYQYTDAPGTVVKLYEGGDGTNILFSADVTDLYTGTTPSGHYRTCNAKGLFQLGSTPASGRIITVDVTGQFPFSGVVTNPIAIALALMTDDSGLPSGSIDSASFASVAGTFAWVAGVYFDPQTNTTAAQAVSTVLGSVGAFLVPSRAGLLRPYLLRALGPAATAVGAALTPDNVVSVTRVVLPDTLDPPPAAWRVGYQHNYTVQTSALSPAAAATKVSYLALPDTYASAASTAVIAAYRQPNYPQPIVGALADLTSAQNVANAMVALWSTRRRQYAVEVPLALGLAYDLGQTISLAWPVEDLGSGQLGQIVGEAVRSSDNTMTFQVLI